MNFEYLLDLCQNTILPRLAQFGIDVFEFVFSPIDWQDLLNRITIWDDSFGISLLSDLLEEIFGLNTSVFEICLVGFIGLTAYRIIKSLIPTN